MDQLKRGQFFGQTNKTIELAELTLTDTEYTHDFVDWHYHENAYITFILEGRVSEINKKETYHCSPGSLLYHHGEDPHYNIKPKGYTRGFQIEIPQNWLDRFDLSQSFQGSIEVSHPDIKFLLYRIFKETKTEDGEMAISIQQLLIMTLSKITGERQTGIGNKPVWVKKVKEILHTENLRRCSLESIADELQIHPVHLSRDFSKYFHCNMGS
jgi:AraC family transcriptional regulator